jgi:uncharacterized repeat protein (TIGR03803 family)
MDGTGFTNLYQFGGIDGSEPYSVLLLQSNVLYGTTHLGGDFGWGIVFGVYTDGSGSVTLYSFSGAEDGRIPFCQLVSSNNLLIGTAPSGGDSGNGTVFSINTDGSGFTNLYMFGALPSASPSTNSDGAHSYAGLILSGNALYGAAQAGGSAASGTVFKLNTDGTSFTTLHNFTALSNGATGTNSDGAIPGGFGHELTLSGNILYGTALRGGTSDNGTVFAIGADGTGFVTLHSFTGGIQGAAPNGGLVLWGNNLFGTTSQNSIAAGSGNGTIFKISLPLATAPLLTITPAASNIILTWPTGATSFALQSTTNLGSSAIWSTNLPAPVVVNGLNTVTNPISASQQFFRLSQ